jgi:hypothetical protein
MKAACYVVDLANTKTDYIGHMLRNSSATPCSGGDMIWVIRLTVLAHDTIFISISRIAAVGVNSRVCSRTYFCVLSQSRVFSSHVASRVLLLRVGF